MCVRWVYGGATIIGCVCVCVCVSWKGAPAKVAYMPYISYIQQTLGATNEAAH